MVVDGDMKLKSWGVGGPPKELHLGRNTDTIRTDYLPRAHMNEWNGDDLLGAPPRRGGRASSRSRRRGSSHGRTPDTPTRMIQVVFHKRSIRRPLALLNNSVYREVTEKGQGGRHGPHIMAPRSRARIRVLDDITEQTGDVETRQRR